MRAAMPGCTGRDAHHRYAPLRRVLAVSAVVALASCDQPRLPAAPSELTTGIVIYEHADYSGASAHIVEDVGHLHDFKGPCDQSDGSSVSKVWDDCISSVRVAPGWQAILYRDGNFDGDLLRVREDVPNLALVPGDCDKGGFNDCVTSIHLVPPR